MSIEDEAMAKARAQVAVEAFTLGEVDLVKDFLTGRLDSSVLVREAYYAIRARGE